ncbi:MAG: hypothetical protein ACXV3E_08760 [Halobacteriota archaeon]
MTQLIDYALAQPEKRMDTLFHKENGRVYENMAKTRSAVKKADSRSKPYSFIAGGYMHVADTSIAS